MDAGNVEPSARRMIVVYAHDHKSLKTNDVVVMVEAPTSGLYFLFREIDCTLHDLSDRCDQYVHLSYLNP